MTIMGSFLLMVIIVVIKMTLSITEPNASFGGVPQDIRHMIYGYLSPEHHYGIRRLNKESHHLFVKLHTNKSNEMDSWMQLKIYLSQLQMTTETLSIRWPFFVTKIAEHTSFAQPFRWNYTTHQIKMIEKLFCIIINNSKLSSSNIQAAVASELQRHLIIPETLDGTTAGRMMDVFTQRIGCWHTHTLLRPLVEQNHHGSTRLVSVLYMGYTADEHDLLLQIMWERAISEYRNTGNIDNRYALFALGYMKWIIRTNYGISEHYQLLHMTDILQETSERLWKRARSTDIAFIHHFLSFDELLVHPIKNKEQLVALIMYHVFAANTTFKSKYLKLFCMGKSVLWDLEYVIRYANDYSDCWSSMRKLLHWIFKHKLSSGPYTAVDVMYLLINHGILSINDVLCESCEIQMDEPLTVSFDFLKYVIDCKESTHHKDRLHRWLSSMPSNYGRERNGPVVVRKLIPIRCAWIENRTKSINESRHHRLTHVARAVFSATHPIKYNSNTTKETRNRHSCCDGM
eukprot:428765_1